MSNVIFDTHIVFWLFEQPSKLSPNAITALENAVASDSKIFLSAISLIEIQYLVEKQRISSTFLSTLSVELNNPESIFVVIPIDRHIAGNISVIPRADVADMADRIISATASLMDIPLISADRAIHASGVSVIW